jgi:hypothetical protein
MAFLVPRQTLGVTGFDRYWFHVVNGWAQVSPMLNDVGKIVAKGAPEIWALVFFFAVVLAASCTYEDSASLGLCRGGRRSGASRQRGHRSLLLSAPAVCLGTAARTPTVDASGGHLFSERSCRWKFCVRGGILLR